MQVSTDHLCRLDDPFVGELDDRLCAGSGTPVEERTAESERLLARARYALDELDEAEAMSALRMSVRFDPANELAARLLEALCHTGAASGARHSPTPPPTPPLTTPTPAPMEAGFFDRHTHFERSQLVSSEPTRPLPAASHSLAAAEGLG